MSEANDTERPASQVQRRRNRLGNVATVLSIVIGIVAFMAVIAVPVIASIEPGWPLYDFINDEVLDGPLGWLLGLYFFLDIAFFIWLIVWLSERFETLIDRLVPDPTAPARDRSLEEAAKRRAHSPAAPPSPTKPLTREERAAQAGRRRRTVAIVLVIAYLVVLLSMFVTNLARMALNGGSTNLYFFSLPFWAVVAVGPFAYLRAAHKLVPALNAKPGPGERDAGDVSEGDSGNVPEGTPTIGQKARNMGLLSMMGGWLQSIPVGLRPAFRTAGSILFGLVILVGFVVPRVLDVPYALRPSVVVIRSYEVKSVLLRATDTEPLYAVHATGEDGGSYTYSISNPSEADYYTQPVVMQVLPHSGRVVGVKEGYQALELLHDAGRLTDSEYDEAEKYLSPGALCSEMPIRGAWRAERPALTGAAPLDGIRRSSPSGTSRHQAPLAVRRPSRRAPRRARPPA